MKRNRGHLRQLNNQALNRPSTQLPTGGSEQEPVGEMRGESQPTAATPEQPAVAAPAPDPVAEKERDTTVCLTKEIPTPTMTTATRRSTRSTAGKLPERLKVYDMTG